MSVKKLLYSVEVSIFTFLVSSNQSQQKEREKKKNPIHLVLSSTNFHWMPKQNELTVFWGTTGINKIGPDGLDEKEQNYNKCC